MLTLCLMLISAALAQPSPCAQTHYTTILDSGEVIYRAGHSDILKPSLPTLDPRGLTVNVDEGDVCVVFVGAPQAPGRVILTHRGRPHPLAIGTPAFTLRGTEEALAQIDLHLVISQIDTIEVASARAPGIHRQWVVLQTRRYRPLDQADDAVASAP